MKKIVKIIVGIFKKKEQIKPKQVEEPARKGPLWEYRTNK